MAINELLIGATTTATDPTRVDGEVAPFTVDTQGRLKVVTKPALYPETTGVASSLGTSFVVNVVDATNLVLHVKNTGTATMSSGSFLFEASLDSTDGANGSWFTIQGVRTNGNTIETSCSTLGIPASTPNSYAWDFSVKSYKYFRVRCTGNTTASSIASWTAVRGSYSTEPAPGIAPHGITGQVTVVPLTGTAYSAVTAASTNAANIKNSAGVVFELTVANVTAATIYVKLYNKASAPTVGTDVPLVTIPVVAGAVYAAEYGIGKRFATGIAIAVTAAAPATDTAVVTAGAQISITYV